MVWDIDEYVIAQPLVSISRINGLWGEIVFQYVYAFHKLNRVIAIKCAEITLAWVYICEIRPALASMPRGETRRADD